MKALVKKELGVTWVYWLSVTLFLGMFGGALYLAATEQEDDRFVFIGAAIIFFAFGVGGSVWPFLRSREGEGPSLEYVHAFGMHCEGILFPASRVKELLTLGGSFFLAGGSALLCLMADTLEHRFQAGLAFVFFAGVLALSLAYCFAGRKGILILPEGLLWREIMRPPCFVPWNSIAAAGLFLKPRRYGAKPARALGLQMSDVTLLQTPSWNRRLIAGARRNHGWHLHALAETINVPLEVVAVTIEHYWRNPAARGEIGSATSLAKVADRKNVLG
jgi:hypothetical protein